MASEPQLMPSMDHSPTQRPRAKSEGGAMGSEPPLDDDVRYWIFGLQTELSVFQDPAFISDSEEAFHVPERPLKRDPSVRLGSTI